MARYKHLPIYKKTYDLLMRIMDVTKNFPREHKYTIGQKLKDEAVDLVVYIYKANSVKDKEVYVGSILERIQVVELLLRLSHDMHILSRKNYVGISSITDEVGRQAQGWHKAITRGEVARTG